MTKKFISQYIADNYNQALNGAERYIKFIQIKNLEIEIEETNVDSYIARIYQIPQE